MHASKYSQPNQALKSKKWFTSDFPLLNGLSRMFSFEDISAYNLCKELAQEIFNQESVYCLKDFEKL